MQKTYITHLRIFKKTHLDTARRKGAVHTGIRIMKNIGIPTYQQCFGFGLDPDSIRLVDPDSDPGGQKLPTKVEKIKIFMF
jgi:hypothetical protein